MYIRNFLLLYSLWKSYWW